MDNIENGELKAEISFLFINRDVKGNEYRSKIIKMAEENDIPVIILPSDTFLPELKRENIEDWRNAFGQEMRKGSQNTRWTSVCSPVIC